VIKGHQQSIQVMPSQSSEWTPPDRVSQQLPSPSLSAHRAECVAAVPTPSASAAPSPSLRPTTSYNQPVPY